MNFLLVFKIIKTLPHVFCPNFKLFSYFGQLAEKPNVIKGSVKKTIITAIIKKITVFI